MTKTEIKQMTRLKKLLDDAAKLADRMDLQDERGGYVGSQLGVIASDIEVKLSYAGHDEDN